MQTPERKTERFASYPEAVDAFFDEPWSDGLPVVPPTPQLVDAMIAAGGRDGSEAIGAVPERELSVHVWQAATCAVMAGCRPEYFPVVLATWDAMLAPRFNLHTVLSSTGGAAIAAVVSGPYADKIGMRSGTGVFGPGNRPNATIGRAIRLGALTALKAIPGELDASSYGHAGKFGFHFAERTPPQGWPTIREQLGFAASATTVTVMAAEAPRQVMHRWQPTAQGMLKLIGGTMRDPSQNATGSLAPYMVVLGPEHTGVLTDAGLTPRDIREALSENSRISPQELLAAGIDHTVPGTRYSAPDATGRFISARPENILVMTAGGIGAGWSAVLVSWSWLATSRPATAAVRIPGEAPAARDASRSELDFV